MPDHTCEDCGAALDSERDTNSAGHYRDRCADCLSRPPDAPPHVKTCDDPDCLVCDSYARERSTDTIISN